MSEDKEVQIQMPPASVHVYPLRQAALVNPHQHQHLGLVHPLILHHFLLDHLDFHFQQLQPTVPVLLHRGQRTGLLWKQSNSATCI